MTCVNVVAAGHCVVVPLVGHLPIALFVVVVSCHTVIPGEGRTFASAMVQGSVGSVGGEATLSAP